MAVLNAFFLQVLFNITKLMIYCFFNKNAGKSLWSMIFCLNKENYKEIIFNLMLLCF